MLNLYLLYWTKVNLEKIFFISEINWNIQHLALKEWILKGDAHSDILTLDPREISRLFLLATCSLLPLGDFSFSREQPLRPTVLSYSLCGWHTLYLDLIYSQYIFTFLIHFWSVIWFAFFYFLSTRDTFNFLSTKIMINPKKRLNVVHIFIIL